MLYLNDPKSEAVSCQFAVWSTLYQIFSLFFPTENTQWLLKAGLWTESHRISLLIFYQKSQNSANLPLVLPCLDTAPCSPVSNSRGCRLYSYEYGFGTLWIEEQVLCSILSVKSIDAWDWKSLTVTWSLISSQELFPKWHIAVPHSAYDLKYTITRSFVVKLEKYVLISLNTC